jgi:hypothetical protein
MQLCPALGEPDQPLVGYAVELWERRQALDTLARDAQWLLGDIDLGWLQRCFPLPIKRCLATEIAESCVLATCHGLSQVGEGFELSGEV